MAIKPGYKTTELLVTVLTIIGSVAFAAADKVPPRYAELASAVSAAAYTLSRGLAKRQPAVVAATAVEAKTPVVTPPVSTTQRP